MKDAIIIDNGSTLCKVGFAGDEVPRSIFPAVIGHSKYNLTVNGHQNKDIYVGNEAFEKRGTCILNYPNKSTGTLNTDEMDLLYHNIFHNELKVDPKEHPILLIEKLYKQKSRIESQVQILFETFNVPSICIEEKSVLALFSTGRDTGIVLHSGDYLSYACPIFERRPIQNAIKLSNVGGNEITESIKNEINFRFFCNSSNKRASEGWSSSPFLFNTSADNEIVRDIKEKCAYVSLDFYQELNSSRNSTEKYEIYRLPDQSVITIQNERFICPEILFKPQTGIDNSVSNLVYNSIQSCNDDIKNNLFDNIVLSGGTTMINGFTERFTSEVKNLVQLNCNVNVIAPKNRNIAAFIGGSIYARSPLFEYEDFSRNQYNENGPGIFNNKFLVL